MASKSSVRRTETAQEATKVPAKPSAAKPVVPARQGRGSEDAQFDRLVYERVRLGIMSALAVNERLTFNELKSLFEVSDGTSAENCIGSICTWKPASLPISVMRSTMMP